MIALCIGLSDSFLYSGEMKHRFTSCFLPLKMETEASQLATITPVSRLAAFILDCIPAVLDEHLFSLQKSLEAGAIVSSREKRIASWRKNLNHSSIEFFSSIVKDYHEVLKFPPVLVNESEFALLMHFVESDSHVVWLGDQPIVDKMAQFYLPEVANGEMKLLIDEETRKFYCCYPPALQTTVINCNGRPLDGVALSNLWLDGTEEQQELDKYLMGLFPKSTEAFVDYNLHPVVKVCSSH